MNSAELKRAIFTIDDSAEKFAARLHEFETEIKEMGVEPKPHDPEPIAQAAASSLRRLRLLGAQVERLKQLSDANEGFSQPAER